MNSGNALEFSLQYAFDISYTERYFLVFSFPSSRGGSRAAATSKLKPLTIITKHSILDVAAALDPPLYTRYNVVIDKAAWYRTESLLSENCELKVGLK